VTSTATLTLGSGAGLGVDPVERPANDELDQSGAGQPRRIDGGDSLPVPQDGDAISDAQDLVEAVGDVKDGLPRVGVAAQRGQQSVHLLIGQRRGWLVEDQDAGLSIVLVLEGADDGDARSVRRPKRTHGCLRGGGNMVALEQLAGAPIEPAPVDTSHDHRKTVPKGDVLRHRERRGQGPGLVDEAQARGVGQLGRPLVRRKSPPPRHDASAGVGLLHPGEDLDQGRLPGTVAP